MTHKSSTASRYITLFVFLGLGLFAAATQNEPSAAYTNSIQTQTQDINTFKDHSQRFVFFYSKILQNTTKTQVTIPFSFKDAPPILFFGYSPRDSNDRKAWLISHPQLLDLNWPVISDADLHLYQKNPQYSSIQEFLSNPPELSSVVVDPLLRGPYPQIHGAKISEAQIDMDKTSFILTTYKPSFFRNGAFYYQSVIDASPATINDENEIEWVLNLPLTDEGDSYLLGNIDITYLQ